MASSHNRDLQLRSARQCQSVIMSNTGRSPQSKQNCGVQTPGGWTTTRALFIAAAVAACAISGAAPASADTAHYLHCIKTNTFAGVSFPFDDNTLVKIGIEAYHATGGPPPRPETVNPEISLSRADIQPERGSGERNCAVRDFQQQQRA